MSSLSLLVAGYLSKGQLTPCACCVTKGLGIVAPEL